MASTFGITISFVGDSRKKLQSFPKPVKTDLGYALYRLQLGQVPPDSKPMQSIGQGVFELREQDDRAWYRLIYYKKIKNVIYVLHCFEKKTNKTELRDIQIARTRLKKLLAARSE